MSWANIIGKFCTEIVVGYGLLATLSSMFLLVALRTKSSRKVRVMDTFVYFLFWLVARAKSFAFATESFILVYRSVLEVEVAEMHKRPLIKFNCEVVEPSELGTKQLPSVVATA